VLVARSPARPGGRRRVGEDPGGALDPPDHRADPDPGRCARPQAPSPARRPVRAMTLARQDLRLTLRDRSSIFWIFLAPVLWVYMFGSITRSTPTRIRLQVVEVESSTLADRLVELLRAENFEVTVVPPGAPVPSGKDAPARSVSIPAGFAGSIAARQKVTLELKEGKNANPEGTIATQVALHR